MERSFAATESGVDKEQARARRCAPPTDYLLEFFPGVRLEFLVSSGKILAISVCEGKRNGVEIMTFAHNRSRQGIRKVYRLSFNDTVPANEG